MTSSHPTVVMTPRVREAWACARDAHSRQQYNGRPYEYHLIGVVTRLNHTHGWGDEDLTILGILHDTVEDTGPEMMGFVAHLFGPRVASGLDAMTRRPGEPYLVYIERLSHNPDATKVKVCDLLENIGQRMTPECPPDKRRHWRRYLEALELLLSRQ